MDTKVVNKKTPFLCKNYKPIMIQQRQKLVPWTIKVFGYYR